MMAAKLGLPQYDHELVDDLLQLLTGTETDMTIFYRQLAELDISAMPNPQSCDPLCRLCTPFLQPLII